LFEFDFFDACHLLQAGVTQLVECHPSKVNVAGSTPVARSSLWDLRPKSRYSSAVEHFHGKEGVVGSIPTNGSRSAAIVRHKTKTLTFNSKFSSHGKRNISAR